MPGPPWVHVEQYTGAWVAPGASNAVAPRVTSCTGKGRPGNSQERSLGVQGLRSANLHSEGRPALMHAQAWSTVLEGKGPLSRDMLYFAPISIRAQSSVCPQASPVSSRSPESTDFRGNKSFPLSMERESFCCQSGQALKRNGEGGRRCGFFLMLLAA